MSRTTRRLKRNPSNLRESVCLALQRGQSMIEYVVVCAALVFTLGIGMIDDKSVLRQLLEAFRTAYEKFSFAISIPY